MAGQKSNLSHTLSGSFLEFYRQNGGTIRIRVYATPNAADYEIVISHAHLVTIVNAMLTNGTVLALAGADNAVVRTSEEIGSMGADHTVYA